MKSLLFNFLAFMARTTNMAVPIRKPILVAYDEARLSVLLCTTQRALHVTTQRLQAEFIDAYCWHEQISKYAADLGNAIQLQSLEVNRFKLKPTNADYIDYNYPHKH